MQTIKEYIESNSELKDMLECYKGIQVLDFVEQSDVFLYDDVVYDADTDEVCKVIYLDNDKKETWAISDILQYAKKEDVPKDRQEIWEKYMSQYEWTDPTYYNARNLINQLKVIK